VFLKTHAKEDYIREQILKSGFPLEIETYSILEQNDWLAFANDYYFDEDEKKEREIDLTAIPFPEIDNKFIIINRVEPFSLDIELAIECKKIDTHAWVFFTRPSKSCYFYSGQTLDFKQIRTNDFESSLFDVILSPPDTGGLLHYSKFDRLAKSYVEVKIEGQDGGRKDIFTACNQLTKFIAYSFQRRVDRLAKDPDHVMIMVFPVIVFNGNLYEATLDKIGNIVLSQRKHILLARTSRLPFAGANERSFLIDIVTKGYFEDYLKAVRLDIRNIEQSLLSKKDILEEGG